MPATTRLTIDTSVALVPGPSSARGLSRDESHTPASARSNATSSPTQRLRCASSVSTSSLASGTTQALSITSSSNVTQSTASSSIAVCAVNTTPWSPLDPTSDDDAHATEEYVLAMHDFEPQHQNVTCLSFQAGQVIHVLNRDSSGWWDGELEGRRGWFPSNYVTSEVGLLTEEQVPLATSIKSGHVHTISTASTNSCASSISQRGKSSFNRTNHRPMGRDTVGSSVDSYCPPLMVPLLHGLSLLQNAVRANRIAHFQPATACIISCVRGILSDIGCLSRDAPILKRYGVLAQERKRILSDLAALVTQAKRASDDIATEEMRDLEVESMVRHGGQLFAHVRGFLAVAVQCGVTLPARGGRPPGSNFGSADTDGHFDSTNGTLVRSEETIAPLSGDYDRHWQASGKTANGIAYRPLARHEDGLRGRTPMRPKSLGDLRVSKKMAMGINYPAVPSSTHDRSPDRKLSDQQLASDAKQFVSGSVLGHKAGQYSVSSVSSSSSFSSGESIGTPATPMFPSGPSTTAEVMEALRYTHDHFLSTIAAFIGHAHSHSRTSHASSTGHMYDLVREVVDMVCKLLTIVEAVLKHPNLPSQKTESLKAAKEGLYNVTSTLADSVRMLTMAPLPDVSEDEEKSTLLRSATNALKAGSDCVNAVKKSLQRTTGARPIIIQLPIIGDSEASIHTPRTFSHSKTHSGRSVGRSLSLRVLRSTTSDIVDEEDLTIQAQSVSSNDPTVTRRPEDGEGLPRPSLVVSEPEAVDDMPMKSPKNKPLPLPRTSHENVQSEVASLLSTAPTDDDRTTWEGSQRHNRAPSSFEQKLLNGDLPAPPLTEFGKSSEIPWTFPHDYAPEDVAYNSDGQLVGATLDALVERMTPHDSLVEPSFAAVFFLTFRLFTTPTELLNAVIARYNILPPPSLVDADLYQWQQRKGLPVRLRVSNFVKSWLESYWRPSTDNVIVPTLLSFTRDALSIMFPVPSQRIIELVNQWAIASETGIGLKVERVRDAGIPLNPPSTPSSEVPRPIMTKTVLSALRKKDFTSLSVTDFDALELGRQLTTMECSLYCAIQPEEVLETGQEGGTYPVNVRAVTSLSTAITGWVAESILDEPDTKKRTALVKFFIKVADRCASLHNFSTPRSILAALDSSTISRLHQTWTGLPQKNKLQLESLRKLADHARNYHEYRSRLRNTAPPAVPFLGLYLTDVTFCREGNPSYRTSPKAPEKKLLNFNKYHKLARIVQDMQRFQVPYTLKEIPEVHEYLKDAFERSKHKGDLQDLYRRSLMVEPKQPADTPPSSDVRQLFGWASRSQVTTPSAS